MSASRNIAFLILFAFLCSDQALARSSVFETVSDDDARIISAFLAPCVELYASARSPFVLLPNPAAEEAVRIASALATRLRDHGFSAQISADDKAEIPVSISVKPLPYGIWLRVLVARQPFFFLFERQPNGVLELSKERRTLAN